jgi:hypothetical protein
MARGRGPPVSFRCCRHVEDFDEIAAFVQHGDGARLSGVDSEDVWAVMAWPLYKEPAMTHDAP